MSDRPAPKKGAHSAATAAAKTETDETPQITPVAQEPADGDPVVNWRRLLEGRVEEVDAQRREVERLHKQVAGLPAVVANLRERMNAVLAQIENLSSELLIQVEDLSDQLSNSLQQQHDSLAREREFWEQFLALLFRMPATEADHRQSASVQPADQVDQPVPAEPDHVDELAVVDEAEPSRLQSELTEVASETPGSPAPDVTPEPSPLPAASSDPIEQLPVVEACRNLSQTALRMADQCKTDWPPAGGPLTTIPRICGKLEGALREGRDKPKETREKDLIESARVRTSELLTPLRELDMLVSGCNERGQQQPLPEEKLRKKVKEVRELLYTFVSTFGPWRELPIREGARYQEYHGRVEAVNAGASRTPMAQQIIQKVLHPGYVKDGSPESTKPARIVLG